MLDDNGAFWWRLVRDERSSWVGNEDGEDDAFKSGKIGNFGTMAGGGGGDDGDLTMDAANDPGIASFGCGRRGRGFGFVNISRYYYAPNKYFQVVEDVDYVFLLLNETSLPIYIYTS